MYRKSGNGCRFVFFADTFQEGGLQMLGKMSAAILSIHPEAKIPLVEFLAEYGFERDPFFLRIALEPVIEFADKAAFSFQPSLAVGMRL
jgi:hypothetical protein